MKNQAFEIYPPQTSSTKLPEIPYQEPKKEVYFPSPELAAAVNVALVLGQPLLLTGEPGTGKTRLAYHLSDCFENLSGPFVFNAQTGSVKKDLFYSYDALGHFQWAQNQKNEQLSPDALETRFIRYEALGKAIKLAYEEGMRSIVLIDEIDKAPRDLPNDLLSAIEELSFDVPEIPGDIPRRWACPKQKLPLIIITSNSEKDLPDAFLRRVVYHHIDFPNDDVKLLEILQAKGLMGMEIPEMMAIIKHFRAIRNNNLGKKPATAELISWAKLLSKIGFPIQKLKDLESLTAEEKSLLNTSYGVLAKSQDDMKKLKYSSK